MQLCLHLLKCMNNMIYQNKLNYVVQILCIFILSIEIGIHIFIVINIMAVIVSSKWCI